MTTFLEYVAGGGVILGTLATVLAVLVFLVAWLAHLFAPARITNRFIDWAETAMWRCLIFGAGFSMIGCVCMVLYVCVR